MKKFVIFIIRKRLGLKPFEGFRFVGQKSERDWYFFGKECVWKVIFRRGIGEVIVPSGVSLNWLLSEKCTIRKIKVICDYFDESYAIEHGEGVF